MTAQPPARRRLRPGTHPDQLAPALAASLANAQAAKEAPAPAAEEPDPAPKPAAKRPAKTSAKAAAAATEEMFTTPPHQTLKVEDMKIPDMQRGFQTLVNDLFADGYDVMTEFREVTDALSIKDALTPQRLQRAANTQEEIANRAHRLYIVGKIEVNAYMRETEGTYGAIREAAIQELEQAKATGSRTKQITDADAKAEAARLYPDQWADICTRRDKAEAMVLQLQNLAALAKSRCYTVSNMANPSARFGGS